MRQNHFRRQRNKFRHKSFGAFRIVAGPTISDLKITALDPSKIIQSLRNEATRDRTSGSFSSLAISIPICRTCLDGCARAVSGQVVTAPPTSVTNSRRRISHPAPDAINKNVSNCWHRSKRRMSELGQKATSAGERTKSALTPIVLQKLSCISPNFWWNLKARSDRRFG